MLSIGDIIKLNYNQSLMLGKIKEIGELMHYILVENVVFMIPIKNDKGYIDFSLQKTEDPIYFVGGGFFVTILKVDNDLYKKYIHTISGLVLVPGSKGLQ